MSRFRNLADEILSHFEQTTGSPLLYDEGGRDMCNHVSGIVGEMQKRIEDALESVAGGNPAVGDPLHPELRLLIKLGSAIIHTEEMISPAGHVYDLATLKALLTDPDIVGWLKQMDAMALLPKKRGQ